MLAMLTTHCGSKICAEVIKMYDPDICQIRYWALKPMVTRAICVQMCTSDTMNSALRVYKDSTG